MPTLDEMGVKGYEVNTWFGFIARAGTPPEIVNRLNAEIQKVLATPAVRDRLAQQGFDLAPPMTPEQFGRIIADDMKTWTPVVKSSGARAD